MISETGNVLNIVAPSLGKLVPVPLREVWTDEAIFFTPWLALPENLKRLGDTLGIELEAGEQEVAVGPFSADILCKDTADSSWVVIENQIDQPLNWHNPEDAKSCKISVRRDGDFRDRSNWPELFEWLLRYLLRFDEVFRPIIKTL